MVCTNCGRINPDGTKFCAFCGSKILTDPENVKCSYCGCDNDPGAAFCWNCGAAMNPEKHNNTAPNESPVNNAQNQAPNIIINQTNPNQIPPEYQPISMWGYFGYEILFAIPVIGFILLIVFSFGKNRNVNLKNFARSYFCILIIVIVVFLLFVLGGGLASLL